MKKTWLFLMVLIQLTCFTFLDSKSQGSEYKIVKAIQLSGDGWWDYLAVDEINQKLFVSHGTQVNVVDIKTSLQLACIPETNGVHGIAVANNLNKAFISCGIDSSVLVIDLKTLKLVTKINGTGKNPDAILYDPFSKKVFTFNGRSNNATVIDAKDLKIIATIPLAGKPEFSQTDGKGKIYVNIEDRSSISVINTATLKVEKTWSISPGEEPSGLAFDNKNHRLFSVCSNKLMTITDSYTGKVITTVPIGDGCDGVAFDPVTKRIFSSNGEGTITVVQQISADKYKVLENIPTQAGARTIAVNTKNHHIYVSVAEYLPGTGRRPVKPNTFKILDIEPIKYK